MAHETVRVSVEFIHRVITDVQSGKISQVEHQTFGKGLYDPDQGFIQVLKGTYDGQIMAIMDPEYDGDE